jgi:glutathione S-transferase
MDVYFSPLACSMASRITLYEAGAPANFIEVDPKTKRTLNGDNFFEINPLGLVPTIRGTVRTAVRRQNAARGENAHA